jgi:AraC family transcriptional regulator of arabinose operon
MLAWDEGYLYPVLGPGREGEIEEAFWDVLRFSIWPGRRRQELSMNALERLLLLCEAELPDVKRPMDDRVREAVEYIHGHLRYPLNLEILAAKVSLSPSRFAHLFRQEAGMPPLQYLSLQRMQRAATLLERTTLTVGEIAAEIGMEPFHFSSKFKAQTGFNPRAYRASRAGSFPPKRQI